MEHGKNMDYAEEIKALKKALAVRDAIIAKQKRDYDALEARFRKLQEKLEEKVKELEAIQEKRRVERARIFVPKTETMKDEPEEQVVNEAEGCHREERGKPGRKRGSRNFNTEWLEKHVEDTEVLFPEEYERLKAEGHVLVEMGEDVSYKVESTPARHKVTKIIRKKFADRTKDTVIQALADPRDFFPHSVATPSLAAELINGKMVLGLPYYRMENNDFLSGVGISRQTMCRIQFEVSDLLKPIYGRMADILLKDKVVYADETTLKVIGSGKSNCYMWVYSSGHYSNPVYVYEFSKDRDGDNPRRMLKRFSGHLVTDAYQGYNGIDGVKNCFCWAHARRNFVEIVKSIGAEARKDSKAAEAVRLIDAVFMEERKMREAGWGPEKIRAARNSEGYQKLLKDVKGCLTETEKTAVGKLLTACKYMLKRWDSFIRYCDDGHIEMTNNISERAVKPFVIARKNFLFSGNADGAESTAEVFSLVQTARANGVDPEKYLAKCIELAVGIKPNDRKEWDRLLPWNLSKEFNLEY